ncbi:MAG TPA: hypothetical protein VME18_05745 [Acidobacteriaceae bacterium]|nr:hypothetical protein [Acidobacteriaceae bacterium]
MMVWVKAPAGSFYASIDLPFSAQEFQLPARTETVFGRQGVNRGNTLNLTGAGEPELEEGAEICRTLLCNSSSNCPSIQSLRSVTELGQVPRLNCCEQPYFG